MKKFLLCTLNGLFALCLPTQAQSLLVRGTVVHAVNRTPLSGAHVFLLQAADSALLVSGMADMNGSFTLKAPDGVGSLLLKTTYLGYTDCYTHIQGDAQQEIAMQVADYAIDQVVVKASIFKRKTDRFIFNVSAAPWLHGTDAVTLLQHTPLVIATGDSKLNIVGKSKTSIRINGKNPHMSQDALLAYLRSLPSENIKSIEVITTPGSEYAASYTGGIINIIVKEQTDGLKGSMRLENGQNKFVNNPAASMNLNFRKRKVAIAASVWGGRSITVMESNSNQHIFESQTDIRSDGRSKQGGGGYVGGRIGLDYVISPRHTLGLHFSKSYRANKSNNWTNDSYRVGIVLDSLMYSYSKNRNPVNQTSASISYLFDIVPSKHKLTMDVSYSNNRRTGNSVTYGERHDENGTIMYRNTDIIQRVTMAIDAWSGRMDYQWTPTSKSALRTGLYLVTTSSDNDTFFGIAENGDYVNDPNRSNHFMYEESIGAAYISYRQEWSDAFETTLGIRGEYMHNRGHQYMGNDSFSNDRFNVFPTLMLSYKGILSYSLTEKIKRPGFNELNPFRHYFSATTYVEHNPFLQSSRSLAQELAYTLKDNFIFQAAYVVNYDAWSQFVIPEDNNVLRYTLVNYGNNKEFNFNFVYTKGFFNGVWHTTNTLAYTYSNFKGDALGWDMDTSSSQFIFMSTNTFILSQKRKWYCDLSFFLDTPYQDADTRFLGNQNLAIGLRKQISSWSFSAKVNDILNTKISRARTTTNRLYSYNEHNYGSRNLYVIISYSFGNKKVKGRVKRNLSGKDVEKRL